jgi:sec-independent protein translocase protein TatA
MDIGPWELLILLAIILLLFGATRLPKLAKSLGEASREFKEGVKGREEEGEATQAASPASSTAATDPNEQVTMSRAELDALLAERERTASKDVPPPAQG